MSAPCRVTFKRRIRKYPKGHQSMFDDVSTNDLRAEVLAFQKSQETTEVIPLPEAADRSKLSTEQQWKLFDNWTAHLTDLPAARYSPAERAAVNLKIIRVLKGL